MFHFTRLLYGAICILLVAGCTTAPEVREVPKLLPVARIPKIALVLGGGAVRGFAHIGVIKVLEAQGISPDIVVGTSAGGVVGALYAAGYSGFELQKIAFQLEESSVGDWAFPDRGFIKGEQLQSFINRAVQNRPIEKLNKAFAVVATDLQTGEQTLFRRGNTGTAVRASSSVPGVFQPVNIGGHEYVDGGLTSPVPVKAARSLGADIVIAVDISVKPKNAKIRDTLDILLQTFAIMGNSISSYELLNADIVIRPNISGVGSTDFEAKHLAIMEGEKAAQAALPAIRQKMAAYWAEKKLAGTAAGGEHH
jgi:NTE family protein